MEVIAHFFREMLPNYLKNLPIPSSFNGFAAMTGKDWLAFVPVVGAVSFLIYVTARAFAPAECPSKKGSCINPDIKKNLEKVADTVDIEDIGEKAVFCRCWRSKKFPYCDGSHNKHNNDCCDNVGPLIIKRKA